MSTERERYWKETFEADGFRTGRVVLPGLELEVDLKPNQFLRYDGIVDSFPKYLRTLSPDVREIIDASVINGAGGFNQDYCHAGAKGFLIAVQDVSPRVNLHNISHEAAEVAWGFGLVSELETHVASLGYPVKLESLTRHQVGVVVGFVQALAAGYDLTDLYRDQDPVGWNILCQMKLV